MRRLEASVYLRIYALYCLFLLIFDEILLQIMKHGSSWSGILDFIFVFFLQMLVNLPLLLLMFIVSKFIPKSGFKIIAVLSPLQFIFIFFYFRNYTLIIDNFEIWKDGGQGRDFLFYFFYNVMTIFVSFVLALTIVIFFNHKYNISE